MTRPTLLILIGIPGSGKSTLARCLAAQLGWERVDRDAIRAAMFPRCAFTVDEKSAAGEAAWLAVETHLLAGRSCIVDGMTFADNLQRERARELADLAAAHHVALMLECPLRVAQARVAAQGGHAAGDRDTQLVQEVASRMAPAGRA